MRIQLLDPPRGNRHMVDVVLDAVSLVHEGLASRGALSSLTKLELMLVYDWAERERRGAVDSRVERRPRPSCLDSAIVVSSFAEIAASSNSDVVTMARFRERLAELSQIRDAPPVFSMAVSSSPRAVVPDRPAGRSADRLASVASTPTEMPRERVDHQVSIGFVLRLPPGAEPPTPTREAVDAAALAMAGPDHEIGPGAKVSCVEVGQELRSSRVGQVGQVGPDPCVGSQEGCPVIHESHELEEEVRLLGPEATPPGFAIRQAEEAAAWSGCRVSRRGASAYVCVSDLGEGRELAREIVSAGGFNGPPWRWRDKDPTQSRACDASEACQRDCGRRCVHAEVRAFLASLSDYDGLPDFLRMVHVKIGLDGRAVPSGGPRCLPCATFLLDQGAGGIWLLEREGLWRYYRMEEFYEVTARTCQLYLPVEIPPADTPR